MITRDDLDWMLVVELLGDPELLQLGILIQAVARFRFDRGDPVGNQYPPVSGTNGALLSPSATQTL